VLLVIDLLQSFGIIKGTKKTRRTQRNTLLIKHVPFLRYQSYFGWHFSAPSAFSAFTQNLQITIIDPLPAVCDPAAFGYTFFERLSLRMGPYSNHTLMALICALKIELGVSYWKV